MNTPPAEPHSRPRSPQRIANSTWAELRTAHASGIGLRELARNVGIPEGTILARAKREGWTRIVRDAKALAVRPAAPVVSVANACATTMAERGQRHVERVAGIVERALPAVEKMTPEALLDRVEDFDRLDRIARRTYGIEDGRRSGVSLTFNMLSVDSVREIETSAP